MGNTALAKFTERTPFVFDDFFKPWNNWFENDLFAGRAMIVPAVNITDNKDDFTVALAVPGMKKDDFNIGFSLSGRTGCRRWMRGRCAVR